MHVTKWWVAIVMVLVPGLCDAQVVISEIMYNPDSFEGRPPDRNDPNDVGELNAVEWLELYNTGAEPVDIGGWVLSDEDGSTAPLPEGAVIEPGEAVVLVPSSQTVAGFRAAWGEQINVYPVGQWGDDGLYNLANGPSPVNERLTLLDAQGNLIDEVNYDDEGDWPSDRPDGPSIYLPPGMIDADKNDQGFNWRSSQPGTHGAKNNTVTGSFNGIDAGSPGTVQADAENDSGDETDGAEP